jgi:hypothetical protein
MGEGAWYVVQCRCGSGGKEVCVCLRVCVCMGKEREREQERKVSKCSYCYLKTYEISLKSLRGGLKDELKILSPRLSPSGI